MTINASVWKDTLVHLFALASRLEGEGQYNLAKLARAAADSLCRRETWPLELPTGCEELALDVRHTVRDLAALGVDPDLLSAFEQGAGIMAEGRLPLIDVTPHPWVCRTCGHLLLHKPEEKCPTCGAWPGTFQRFLPNYWLDALEPFAALEQLQRTPTEVKALLEGLSEDQLERQPTDGGWAIRNVISHLLDAQGVLAYRLDLFMTMEHPVLESKAVFAWARKEDERPPSVMEIFSTYLTSRSQTVSRLQNLPLADWWKTGRHEEFGILTLRQQVSYFTAHELTHLPQMDALRREFLR
jgi:hypothetical protein